jgi:hypothetical protein
MRFLAIAPLESVRVLALFNEPELPIGVNAHGVDHALAHPPSGLVHGKSVIAAPRPFRVKNAAVQQRALKCAPRMSRDRAAIQDLKFARLGHLLLVAPNRTLHERTPKLLGYVMSLSQEVFEDAESTK